MSLPWSAELTFAEHLAEMADAISMRHFRNPSTRVRSKPDGTPVTEADESVEEMLRAEIASSYPDHGIFGEEGGATGDAATRWILDPIDGTKNFSWGIPVWATLIALEADGEVVCGVASAPALGERWTAARGHGARRNGEAIAVSDVASLAEARLGFTSVAREGSAFQESFQLVLNAVAHNRGLGDFYGHVLVASGSLDVMLEPGLAPWDMGPLIVIVEEAGGRLTDFSGRRGIYSHSCLTTNGRLHDEVLQIVGGEV